MAHRAFSKEAASSFAGKCASNLWRWRDISVMAIPVGEGQPIASSSSLPLTPPARSFFGPPRSLLLKSLKLKSRASAPSFPSCSLHSFILAYMERARIYRRSFFSYAGCRVKKGRRGGASASGTRSLARSQPVSPSGRKFFPIIFAVYHLSRGSRLRSAPLRSAPPPL